MKWNKFESICEKNKTTLTILKQKYKITGSTLSATKKAWIWSILCVAQEYSEPFVQETKIQKQHNKEQQQNQTQLRSFQAFSFLFPQVTFARFLSNYRKLEYMLSNVSLNMQNNIGQYFSIQFSPCSQIDKNSFMLTVYFP